MSKNVLYTIQRYYGSPFLNVKAGKYDEFLRAQYNKVMNNYFFVLEKYSTHDHPNAIKVHSIDTGENLFISYAKNIIIDDSYYQSYGYNYSIFDVFTQEANRIALDTKRGRGNVILMNPEMFYTLIKHKQFPVYAPSRISYDNYIPSYLGRWKYQGQLIYGDARIYTSQCLNVDDIVITYKSRYVDHDKVGSILYNDGILYAIFPEYIDYNDNENIKLDAEKYIRRLKIESVR